ncbi:alpha/beta hydrolase [Clostridium sp. LIBA-8841]|uniref:alpha/beta hydrolase n=1 Tax=Clostridium sp. LIBA-8841 TaxID=2987530 RepID=UPI002AC3A273|nr:alpha/beta hydrolase [Clostridium sp. LIBA-8841]MDZ5252530.1 alpha/beta hydrolase [Clostridium sp. LIBA-8841]
MKSFNIEKQSMWKCRTNNKLICNESETLVILLPGLGYTLDKAILDYSKQLVLDLNYDCLGIEYGFQVSRETFNRHDEEDIRELFLESLDVVFSALEFRTGKYKNIVIIGKSLGTVLQNKIGEEIKKVYNIEVKNIYLTPINETFKDNINKESLIITGTKDALISSDNLEKIKEEKFNVLEIEDAGHSLCIKGNVLESIRALELIIKVIKNYLEKI